MRFPEDRVILDNLRNKNDTSEHMEFMFTFSDDILLPYYKLNFSFSTSDADEKAIEKMRVYPDIEEDYRNNMEIIETEAPLPDTVLEEMSDEILKQLESIQFTKEKEYR